MTDLDALYSWEHWSDFLYRLGAISTPADLQGFISGILAGGEQLDTEQWRVMAEEFMDLPEPLKEIESQAAMDAYAVFSQRALADQEYGFRLLLPDDAVPLSQRVEALGQWSQSFLTGLGMSRCDTMALDEDGKDMLSTLAEIAQIDTDLEDNDENERLYMELGEFIRVGALYLYQFHQQQTESDAGSIH